MRYFATLLIAATLAAPGFARDRDDDYRRGDNGRYGRSNGDWQRFGASPVRAAVRDLQAIGSRARLSGRDRNHVRDGIERLLRFDDRLRAGHWDGGAIDKGIEHVRDLVDANQLHPRDRSVLREHLYALREFRSNRGGASYGYRRPY
jgi:hypothetical protein